MAREDVALVARTDEVRTLTDALAAAGDSRPGVWLVAGDAGVGKSRLVREVSERARDARALVLTGQCVDLGGAGLPYLPFAEALGQAASDPATARAFDDLPALGPLLGRGAARRDAGDDDRLPLFDAVHTALGRLGADHGPVLLVVEDLHWADASSRDLLRFVASRLRHERLLVVATYRSDDLHRGHPLRPLLGELPRLPVVERIDLAPFSTEELGRYLGLLRGQPLPRQVVLDMHRRTDGNAYFAEELLAVAATDGGRPDGLAELPWTLTDVLTSRLDQLPPGTQQLVRVASVAGRRVTDRLLLEVSGLPAAEVDAALREAVAHQVLVPDEREGYRFRHALLREAVYHDLLPGERVRTHARFAAALADSTDPGAAAALAHHHLAGNDLAGAFTASLRAADEADAVRAPAEAVRFLEQALELWDAVPDAADRAGCELVDLELRTAATASRAGGFHRAIALAESALRRAEGGGVPARQAAAERSLAQHLYNADREHEAVEHAARAVELLAADPQSADAVWAAAIWAKSLVVVDEVARGREVAVTTLERARASGLQGAEADLLATLAVVDWSEGDMDLSYEHLVHALGPATASGDASTHLRIAHNIATNRFYAGDLPAAVQAVDAAVEVARRAGLTWSPFGMEALVLQVIVRYHVGDWAGSLRAAEVAGEHPPDLVANRLAAASTYVQVGRGLAGTTERLRDLRSAWHQDGAIALVSGGCGVDLLTWSGRPQDALVLADEALDSLAAVWGDFSLGGIWLGALGLAAAADIAVAARLVHDDATARRATEHGERLLDRVRVTAAKGRPRSGRIGPEGLAWLQRAEAEASRLRGDDDVDAWRATVAAFDYGYLYEVARSRWRLAEVLLRTDARQEATEHAAAAHDVATRLGAQPLEAAVEALAVRGRLEIGVALARPADAVLTPRERQVLALVAEGLTNRQVGARLFISEKTASVHLSNLMAKLGASSRTEAVTVAHRRGLLG